MINFGTTRGNTFVVPRFGKTCVCCNIDTMGRTQDYDPSTDRIQAPSIQVPVCGECHKHALQTHTGPIMMGCLLVVGIAATALGFMKLDERPNDEFLYGMVVFGFAAVAATILWFVAVTRRQRAHEREGHHPGLMFSVDFGTTLNTSNDALADELVALNPGATRVATRADRKRLPRARVVKRTEQDPNPPG